MALAVARRPQQRRRDSAGTDGVLRVAAVCYLLTATRAADATQWMTLVDQCWVDASSEMRRLIGRMDNVDATRLSLLAPRATLQLVEDSLARHPSIRVIPVAMCDDVDDNGRVRNDVVEHLRAVRDASLAMSTTFVISINTTCTNPAGIDAAHRRPSWPALHSFLMPLLEPQQVRATARTSGEQFEWWFTSSAERVIRLVLVATEDVGAQAIDRLGASDTWSPRTVLSDVWPLRIDASTAPAGYHAEAAGFLFARMLDSQAIRWRGDLAQPAARIGECMKSMPKRDIDLVSAAIEATCPCTTPCMKSGSAPQHEWFSRAWRGKPEVFCKLDEQLVKGHLVKGGPCANVAEFMHDIFVKRLPAGSSECPRTSSQDVQSLGNRLSVSDRDFIKTFLCQHPVLPDGVAMVRSRDWEDSKEATFSCRPGYALIRGHIYSNHVTLRCDTHAKDPGLVWQSIYTAIRCQACAPPSAGHGTVQTLRASSSVPPRYQVVCDLGYTLNGADGFIDAASCEPLSGAYPQVPRCHACADVVPHVENATYSWQNNTVVTYACSAGFCGGGKKRCDQRLGWVDDGPEAQCEAAPTPGTMWPSAVEAHHSMFMLPVQNDNRWRVQCWIQGTSTVDLPLATSCSITEVAGRCLPCTAHVLQCLLTVVPTIFKRSLPLLSAAMVTLIAAAVIAWLLLRPTCSAGSGSSPAPAPHPHNPEMCERPPAIISNEEIRGNERPTASSTVIEAGTEVNDARGTTPSNIPERTTRDQQTQPARHEASEGRTSSESAAPPQPAHVASKVAEDCSSAAPTAATSDPDVLPAANANDCGGAAAQPSTDAPADDVIPSASAPDATEPRADPPGSDATDASELTSAAASQPHTDNQATPDSTTPDPTMHDTEHADEASQPQAAHDDSAATESSAGAPTE